MICRLWSDVPSLPVELSPFWLLSYCVPFHLKMKVLGNMKEFRSRGKQIQCYDSGTADIVEGGSSSSDSFLDSSHRATLWGDKEQYSVFPTVKKLNERKEPWKKRRTGKRLGIGWISQRSQKCQLRLQCTSLCELWNLWWCLFHHVPFSLILLCPVIHSVSFVVVLLFLFLLHSLLLPLFSLGLDIP